MIGAVRHLRNGLSVKGLVLAVGLLAFSGCGARADFRHTPQGARPMALGSAYVAIADDANAAYWNPAGLTLIDKLSLMVTNGWLYGVSDIQNYYIAATLPRLGPVHFGASWIRQGIADTYYEDTINLALAAKMPFLEGLSLGLAGKMFLLAAPGYEVYNDPSYNNGDQGYTFDLGLHYDSGGAWTLGAAFHNLIETELQLLQNTSDPDPVFSQWAAGGSYLFRETLLVTIDLRNREGRPSDIIVHGGCEIWFFDAMVLRAGLDQGLVTMGAGLQDDHWQADFSLQTDKNLGNVYMLSFTVRN